MGSWILDAGPPAGFLAVRCEARLPTQSSENRARRKCSPRRTCTPPHSVCVQKEGPGKSLRRKSDCSKARER